MLQKYTPCRKKRTDSILAVTLTNLENFSIIFGMAKILSVPFWGGYGVGVVDLCIKIYYKPFSIYACLDNYVLPVIFITHTHIFSNNYHYLCSISPDNHAYTIRYTIRYDNVYLTCSKKLMGSQLSPPHGTNKKN